MLDYELIKILLIDQSFSQSSGDRAKVDLKLYKRKLSEELGHMVKEITD